MNTGPKGVDMRNPVELQLRERSYQKAQRPAKERDDGPDAVVDISARASSLNNWLSTEKVETEALDGELKDVDSRTTAEAIMKRIVPDLYQALVDAGEIED